MSIWEHISMVALFMGLCWSAVSALAALISTSEAEFKRLLLFSTGSLLVAGVVLVVLLEVF